MASVKVVEEIIRSAIARGEFDDLPGRGKPIDLSEYFNTPEDIRLVISILKNAGILPEEIELLKEIEALKNELRSCEDKQKCQQLRQEIEGRLLKFNIKMEQRQRQRSKTQQ